MKTTRAAAVIGWILAASAAGLGAAESPEAREDREVREAEEEREAAARRVSAESEAAEASVDPRSRVVLDLDCSSRLGRTRTTLFGNGTVRYREWVGEDERMLLLELGPDRRDGYVDRLAEIDLSEAESARYGAAGDWVEQCRVELDLPSRSRRDFSFNRYDSLPLALSRLIAVADELEEATEREATRSRFPRGYEPGPGDVLERRDGVLFEVVAYTGDGRGIELRGIDQPLVIYVPVDDLLSQFVRLVEDPWER